MSDIIQRYRPFLATFALAVPILVLFFTASGKRCEFIPICFCTLQHRRFPCQNGADGRGDRPFQGCSTFKSGYLLSGHT